MKRERMEELKENRSLLTRTMSFRPPNLVISAKALRKRFALSKRSLSDTWKDKATLIEENGSFSQECSVDATPAHAEEVVRPASPPTPAPAPKAPPSPKPKPFISQRSRSLDSLKRAEFALTLGSSSSAQPDLTSATLELDFPSPPLDLQPNLIDFSFPMVNEQRHPLTPQPLPTQPLQPIIVEVNEMPDGSAEQPLPPKNSTKEPSYIMYPPSTPLEPPSAVLLPQISVNTAPTPQPMRTSSMLANSAIPLLMLAPCAQDAESLERTKLHLNLISSQADKAGPLKPSEKRRRFFMRKQTNSAPDSFDGPGGTHKAGGHHSVSFCLGVKLKGKCHNHHHHATDPTVSVLQSKLNSEPEMGVEHLSDLSYPDADPPCHFCCHQTSTSVHDENRLTIMSRGLVRSRDGSREPGGSHYMNLPSPNVQTAEESNEEVFQPRMSRSSEVDTLASRRESSISPPPLARRRRTQEAEAENSEATTPPASALARRRALVPPKLMAEDENSGNNSESERKLSTGSDGPRTRRSSIVVIPPMQICPGDLLVYSKVLTQRNNLTDFDGSTSSLAVSEADNARKSKNTWSLLKLFDRSSRGKSETTFCGLEECLGCIQRVEFNDDQLTRFRGMNWSDFVVHVDTTSGARRRSSSTSSTSSSNNESTIISPGSPEKPEIKIVPSPAPPQPEPEPPKKPPDKPTGGFERRFRVGLMRTQSEKSFERRLTGAMWKGLDKALPERVLPLRPSPLISTLSEKDLLGSKEQLASPVSTVSRNECKRKEALWDLFQSECAFLYDHLMVLNNVFMEPLKKIQVEGFAMFAEPELLFGNLDELCLVTYAFCKEFINLILQHVGTGGEMSTTEVLVKLFQKSTKADSVSQAYHCYALNYINALNYLETLRRHMEFIEFEKWCNRDPRCKKLQLTDLLVAPVQHIMKVPLILKEVESRTEEAEERDQIARILEREENSLRELDDKMKWLKNFERLLEIQRNIVWPSILELDPKTFVPEFLKPALARQPCDRIIVSPRRQIVMEGPLSIFDSGKPAEMYVILFDDMLLITRRKKGLSKKKSSLTENWASTCGRGNNPNEAAAMRYIVYKQPLSLDRFFIHDVSVSEGGTCRMDAAFVIVSLNRFQQIVAVHTFQAANDQLKQTWLLKLRDTQDKWKRTLQHTVFKSDPRLSTCSRLDPRYSTCSSRKSTT
ncbi:uncharacterized protein LOC132205895 [Neocloeon triangulifer]|uniref:uncharacterized protein LOC132205895 n=1 Tax=Neocloeon triangulifer TaxID=2078957 RepID=UPI00286F1A56|nr:uncharacterized protein LOC132205895 [Neocloeon triangulifer]